MGGGGGTLTGLMASSIEKMYAFQWFDGLANLVNEMCIYGCKPTRDSTWHLDNILVQEETEYRCLKEWGAQYGVLYGAWRPRAKY